MNGRLTLAGILLALPLSGMAVPIDGEIGLSGALVPNGASFLATGELDFGANGYGTDGVMGVTFATGDFADITPFVDTGLIADFDFDNVPPPVDPLWTISGTSYDWEFALETVTVVTRMASFLDLSGTGILRSSDPGLDDTMGFWSFSADASGSIFSWSSTNVPTPMPEPGILLVFGIGLFGLAAARRFRR